MSKVWEAEKKLEDHQSKYVALELQFERLKLEAAKSTKSPPKATSKGRTGNLAKSVQRRVFVPDEPGAFPPGPVHGVNVQACRKITDELLRTLSQHNLTFNQLLPGRSVKASPRPWFAPLVPRFGGGLGTSCNAQSPGFWPELE